MEISISPELEEYVANKVASGEYNSANAVVEAALGLLEDQECDRLSRVSAFQEELGKRLSSLDRGEHVAPEAARERIRRKSHERRSAVA